MLKKTILALAAVSLVFGSSVMAAVGKTWTTSGTDQFGAGKLEGVAVFSTGEVELAPETEQIEGLEAEFVWDVEAAADGTVYVATGSPAAVYTVSGTKADLLHKSEEKHVLSVLPLPDGSVLAGTAPNGIIFRIDRRGGVETLADLEDSYVWDMALGPFNDIYCATGPQGRLIELNRAGKVTELLKAKQKNLMCVAADREGTVYAGTDTDGYVYRVERGGRAAVLYDAEESEIHDLVLDDQGVLYVCTAQSESSRKRPGSPQGSSGQPPPERPTPLPSPAAVKGAPGAYNSIYRIVPGQGAVLLARFDKTFVLSLALADGDVLGGTGANGRLMAVRPDMVFKILTEFDAAHITAMAADPEGDVVIGTSNAGGLWRLKKGCRAEGSLISKTFDAGYLSRWGRVWWKEKTATGQSVRVKLRTGNSGEPDDHWSPWSRWATDAVGQVLDLPMGRFAQFSAELSTRPRTGSPLLLQVEVSYRQANRKPRILELTMDGKSLLDGTQRGGPSGGRPQPPAPPGARRPGAVPTQKALAWKAFDPNGDELLFHLYYRGVDESEWKEIEKDLRRLTSYKWDTSRVPDGYYVLKLVARDDVVRPEDEALSDERVTSPLLIDNRRPAVHKLTARRLPDGAYDISGTARDEHSPITKIEVSHNSEDWMPVFPADGILDSPEEAFSYRTEVLEPGEHVFVFVAADANQNAGSGKVVVTVRPERE